MSPEKRNYHTHIGSLTMTKLADGLLDPKLVLAWLLTTLGSGAVWVGWLVPVREAGALLPQLFIAEPVRRMAVRKWAWIGGSVVQALAALGMVGVALWLEGAVAGMVIVGLVAVLAIARSVSSVSYKDVLGKTVAKTMRGRVSGTAASIAAAGVFLFGSLLVWGFFDRFTVVVTALALAGGLWVLAAAIFMYLQEAPSTQTNRLEQNVWVQYWHYLKTDQELQKLILVRGLLIATAIAPPYLLLLANEVAGTAVGQLGSLVLASSLATLVSGRVWGVLSDRSTPLVLTVSGVGASLTLLTALVAAENGYLANGLVLPALVFVLFTAYQGVRIARTTHLVNIANENTRTGYTAVSNTIIGILLLLTGGLGWLAAASSLFVVVTLLAFLSMLGGLVALGLTA